MSGDGFIELRGFIEDPSVTKDSGRSKFYRVADLETCLGEMGDLAQRWNREGRGVYFGVHERTELSGKADSVKRAAIIPIDLDCWEVSEGDAETYDSKVYGATMTANTLGASIIVDSGNGVWAYVNIEGHDLSNDDGRATYTETVKAVAQAHKSLGGDDSVSDPARVGRAAGTWNLKGKRGEGAVQARLIGGGTTFTDINGTVTRFKTTTLGALATRFGDHLPKAKTPSKTGLIAKATEALGRWKVDPTTVKKGHRRESAKTEVMAQRNRTNDEEMLTLKMQEWYSLLPDVTDFDFEGDAGIEGLINAAMARSGGDWEQNNEVGVVDPDDDRDGLKVTKLGDLLSTPITLGDDLINGLYRKMQGMVYGPDGIGKTVYTLYGIFCQMVNKPFGDFVSVRDEGHRPLRVLYVEAEDGEDEANDRIRKILGGTYSNTRRDGTIETVAYDGAGFTEFERRVIGDHFEVITEGLVFGAPMDLSLPGHRKAFERYLIKGNYDLVIVDTLKQTFSSSSENDNTDMQTKVVTPMKALALRYNLGVLYIHHTGHDGKRSRGSSAMAGAMRYRRQLFALREADTDDVEGGTQLRSDRMFRSVLEKDKRSLSKAPTYHRVICGDDLSLSVSIEDKPSVITPKLGAAQTNAEKAHAFLATQTDWMEGSVIKATLGLSDDQWKKATPLLQTMPGFASRRVANVPLYRVDLQQIND